MLLSIFIISMVILAMPLLFLTWNIFHLITNMAVKTAFFVSMSLPVLAINESMSTLSFLCKWVDIPYSPLNLTFQIDKYNILFIPIALMVAWSIVEYSAWYMRGDINIRLFFKYLLIFLLAMMILVTAGDLLSLFIGWEGVGIMSYLLIGWYFARSYSGAAAFQAIIYNRVGDIGFLFAMFWTISTHTSTNLEFLFTTNIPTPIIMALIVAAASKSAQFSLHPWLASAMEGPTPVSAFLHSSTMVVAGVFLLIRIHPMIKDNQYALTTCLCLGAISTAFAATCALGQFDMKKIIAYSTSSQLGLMIVAIGLNMPDLAFFHICTHAFFKAMLFLCSGAIIHSLHDEQDMRKMGGLHNTHPFTTSCTILGSLALMGTPYLAGFYSKDAIIEAMNYSMVNTWALTLTIIATSFTAMYSLRIILFAFTLRPRFTPVLAVHETTSTVTSPLKRLALGAVVSGLLLNQIILPSTPTILTMPPHLKMLALTVSLIGFIIAMDLTYLTLLKRPTPVNTSKLISPSFIQTVIHRVIPTHALNFSLLVATHLIDTLWLMIIGPKGFSHIQLSPVKAGQAIQRGIIKIYLSVFAFSTLLCLIILQLL